MNDNNNDSKPIQTIDERNKRRIYGDVKKKEKYIYI